MATQDKEQQTSFMEGRNGADELVIACVWVAVILMVINLFAAQTWLIVATLIVLAYAVFRMLSKNVVARRKESEAFASKLGPVRPWLRNPLAASTEAREFKHASCPQCKQRLRVPRGKGKLVVTCPSCGKKFDLKS